MLCEVDYPEIAAQKDWCWSWFDGEKFRCTASTREEATQGLDTLPGPSTYRITRWRACEQAPAKTAELEPTRPAMPSEPCDVWMQTNAGVRESDEAGIDAFVPPPEREKPAVATPRLMHGQRWHGWIWGAM
jgi:hypothetical protein